MIKTICVICGCEYDAPRIGGKYCSSKCRNRRPKRRCVRKYETRICVHCGNEYTARADMPNKYCGYECYWDSMITPGVLMSPGGYITERVRGKGRKFQHRIIMERRLGRELRDDEVIHHIDHDKTNNDISNLVVMTRSEHTRLHTIERMAKIAKAN